MEIGSKSSSMVDTVKQESYMASVFEADLGEQSYWMPSLSQAVHREQRHAEVLVQ